MQFRRTVTFLATLLLGLTGAATILTMMASADMVKKPMPGVERELMSRVKRADLRTYAGSDPETVWVGHIADAAAHAASGVPGTAGGYGPYHIGRGPYRLTGGGPGPAATFNGIWDFDHLQAGEVDSLMGWWPVTCPFSSVGPSNLPDNLRSWFCWDYGNQGNYVINQGSDAGGVKKRTFGVTGYWHRDGGSSQAAVPIDTDHNPVAPSWAPLAGSNSAWCGLRSHGDGAVVDPVTGNPYNSAVLDYQGTQNGSQVGSLAASGTDHNFPGYGSQWDQMLYRDVPVTAGAGLALSFSYSTNMSTNKDNVFNRQAGWFQFDPLATPVANPANFISANNTVGAPVDSFMVYVGQPVDGAVDAFLSDGTTAPVYDAKRRWFSEVIRRDNYTQLLSVGGIGAAAPAFAIPAGTIDPMIEGGVVRVVFRVKTNRGFDDEDQGARGFSSGSAGAAIIDNVVAGAVSTNFEGADDINNSLASTAAWHSTGKPPGIYFHLHNVATLPFDDPCGALSASARLCNMFGKVASPGDHDASDKPGGLFGSTAQDQQKWFASPTINMVNTGVDGQYNGMGIDREIAEDRNVVIVGDQMVNLYDFSGTGNGFRYVMQSYPATQANGVNCWGEGRKTAFFNSWEGLRGCFNDGTIGVLAAPADDNVIRTSNTNGVPDSIRIYIESMARCFTLNLTSAKCSPTSGASAGGYYDNFSIGFAGAPPPPALAVVIWDLFNDAFPVNTGNQIPFANIAFDTLAAHVGSGFNAADQTGDVNRHVIPGDSAAVGAQDGRIGLTPGTTDVRVDLVFRILPGVGNYVTVGTHTSGVIQRPDIAGAGARLAAKAVSGDGSFWGQYMANNGEFGTVYPGNSHAHPGGAWDPNGWNSARCDTVEQNFFDRDALGDNLSAVTLGQWQTTYHESDPKFGTLGVFKNRCFILPNNQGKFNFTETYVHCGGDPPGLLAPGDWPALAGKEYDAVASGLANEGNGKGSTKEFSKIIPDGQLTPGAHVEYFFRKSNTDNAAEFEMVPDTNSVFPQVGEGSFDFHRWQGFSVLPDRWKSTAFNHPVTNQVGQGMACMLVVDLADRRGEEPIWVAMADSIGLTAANRRGAHNGWSARPDQNIFGSIGGIVGTPGTGDAVAVRQHLGQPGSLWDFFQVKAGESNVPAGRLGSRAASRTSPGVASGPGYSKFSEHGPSEAMLLNFYRTMVFLAGDLAEGSIGPIIDQSDNDIGLLTAFLITGGVGTTAFPRGLTMMGADLVRGQNDPDLGHPTFFATHFKASLRDDDYRALSTNTENVANLNTLNVEIDGSGPASPTNWAFTYGVFSPCFLRNDVLNAETGNPAGLVAAEYENTGAFGPYTASVYANEDGPRESRSLVSGFSQGLFNGMGTKRDAGPPASALLPIGVRKYWYEQLTNIWALLCSPPAGAVIGIGDSPNGNGSVFVDYMNLKSRNPMRSGQALISFGVSKTERVEIKVYDVSGRHVKTVANRVFPGGQEHVVTWDGTDEAGQKVARGVYFYQLKSPTFVSQKKLAVLPN